ncbi:hypothetical protein ON010_g2482 [Phytophthora cinnamomi]|nr:hypothetical protein ON010_g2482 [Phytophthora cinnamomi]
MLPSTEGLLYLKCLEKLRVLNLSGNPVCSDPEYRPFLLAHLEKLQYLDYALVDENETVQAREQYQDELEELREVKAIEDAALAREAEQQKYLNMLRDANVIILETLLTDMFKEDTEMSKIEVLPGLRNIIDDYTEKAKTAAEDVKLVLLEKHSALTKEVDGFKATYEKLQADAQEASIRAVENHRRTAKQLLKQAAAANSVSNSDVDGSGTAASLQLLHDAEVSSEKLHNELMNLESDVVETAQELITAMESSIEAVGSEARDIATEHFRTIEVLENNFFENVSQLAVTLLERMASDDGEDDDYLTDECRAILNDRDALNNAINGSHDIHIGKLLAQEDAMREQSLAKVAEIVKGAKEQEWSRNRARIAEVLHLKDKHLGEINRQKRSNVNLTVQATPTSRPYQFTLLLRSPKLRTIHHRKPVELKSKSCGGHKTGRWSLEISRVVGNLDIHPLRRCTARVSAVRVVYSILSRLDVSVRGHDAAGHLEERVEVVLDVLGAAAPVLAGVVEDGRAGVVPARRLAFPSVRLGGDAVWFSLAAETAVTAFGFFWL